MEIVEEDILIKPKPLENLLLWLFFINLVFSVCLLFEISWISKVLTLLIVNAIVFYWVGFRNWECCLTKTHYYKKKHFSEPTALIPYEKFREIYIGTHYIPRLGNYHVIEIHFRNESGKKELVRFLFNKKINYKDEKLVFNQCKRHFLDNMTTYTYKLFFEKDKKWIQVKPQDFNYPIN